MHTTYYIILAISTFLFASLGVYAAYLVLQKFELFDTPNERSNHTRPVPTGAGIAFILPVIGFLIVVNAPENLLWGTLLLTLVSFMDDRKYLPVTHRMGVQLIAVLLALGTVDGPILQGYVPLWLDYPIKILVWMWFMNLTNFMDGIDEITVTETGSICIGLVALGLFVSDVPRWLAIDGIIILAGVLAFFPWNRHPANLFMGDAGSIPLGFLLAYLLLSLAGSGHPHAALILPAFYLCDAGITLMRRALARKPVWQAHSEHFYQRAVRSGWSHRDVSRTVMTLNLFLIALACMSTAGDAIADVTLAIAYVMTGIVLWYLVRRQPRIHADAMAA